MKHKDPLYYVACHGPDGTLLTRPAGFNGPVLTSHSLSELRALTNIDGSGSEWDGSPLRIEVPMDQQRPFLVESSPCTQQQQRAAVENLAGRLVTSEVWEVLVGSTKSLEDLIHQVELQIECSANNNTPLPPKGCPNSGDDTGGTLLKGASYVTTWNLGRHSWLSQDSRTSSQDHPHPRDLKMAMARIRRVVASTSLLGRTTIGDKVNTTALPTESSKEGMVYMKTAAEAQHRFALFLYHDHNNISEQHANTAASRTFGHNITYALAVQVEPGRVVKTCHDYQQQRKLVNSRFLTPLRPPLALLMANMARVELGSVVLDPFCGSGSLLWAASHAGAGHCIGSDVIEHIGLLAKTTSVTSSVKMQPDDGVTGVRACSPCSSELLQCDVFSLPRVLRRSHTISTGSDTTSPFLLDAILTDPPYGLREDQSATPTLSEGRATGSKPKRIIMDAMKQQSAQKREKGMGSQCYIEDYTGEELLQSVSLMMEPVFRVAVEHLKPGRRLVYLLPLFPSQADLGLWGTTGALRAEVISSLPCLPGLTVVSAERHRCQKRGMARAIVVMERASATVSKT